MKTHFHYLRALKLINNYEGNMLFESLAALDTQQYLICLVFVINYRIEYLNLYQNRNTSRTNDSPLLEI